MVLDILIVACLVLAGIFGLVGSYGLLKLKDPMSRLHAPTKTSTLGVGGVLIASMLHAIAYEGHASGHELLVTLFLMVTAPVTANFIAKVYINKNTTPEDLPDPGPCKLWATHDTPARAAAALNSDTASGEGTTLDTAVGTPVREKS